MHLSPQSHAAIVRRCGTLSESAVRRTGEQRWGRRRSPARRTGTEDGLWGSLKAPVAKSSSLLARVDVRAVLAAIRQSDVHPGEMKDGSKVKWTAVRQNTQGASHVLSLRPRHSMAGASPKRPVIGGHNELAPTQLRRSGVECQLTGDKLTSVRGSSRPVAVLQSPRLGSSKPPLNRDDRAHKPARPPLRSEA